jgi:hypothetical protein
MAKERLSKLQGWILKTTIERGGRSEDIGIYIFRKHLVYYRFPDKNGGEKMENSFNVALTRSIRNLFTKGFIRIFKIDQTPELLLRIGLKQDAQTAKMRRTMKVIAGEKDTDQEDETISLYEKAKESRKNRKNGMVQFEELTSASGTIQIISLTEKGERTANC